MKKVIKIIGLIFSAIGIIFCAVAIIVAINLNSFFNSAEKTTGYISDITNDEKVYVTYEVNGEKYEEKLSYYSSSMRENDKITLYYEKDNVEEVRVKHYIVPIIFVINGGVFFIIGILFLITLNLKEHSKKKIMANGRKIYAKITMISPNYSVTVNRTHSYNIYCQYTDEIENKIYEFKSEDILYDPTSLIDSKTIVVYVLDDEYKKYVVDIDSVLNANIIKRY